MLNLKEWNERLVKAVFVERAGASSVLTRIDATDKFLAKAGGFAKGSDARKAFLSAMPATEHGIRSLFNGDVLIRWSVNSSALPFYAQLHLTILAASADEALYEEGNFRARFAELLGLDCSKNYVSGFLPRLWEEAAHWSEIHSRRGRGIKRLILPDPACETIIGYSKKLAFPTYRDQHILADLFAQRDIDATSPIRMLLSFLQSSLPRFSLRFREEFHRFYDSFRKGDRQGALDSPFWDVLVETTSFRKAEIERKGDVGCRLEIDPTDPLALGLWLYCAKSVRGLAAWSLVAEDLLNETLVLWKPCSPLGPGAFIKNLLGLTCSGKVPKILGERLNRGLRTGFLGFVQDEQGRWLDALSAPESGRVWLLVKRKHMPTLEDALARARKSPPFIVSLAEGSSWFVLGPIDAKGMDYGIFENSLDGIDFFRRRLAGRKIEVEGSVRIPGKAYLFLPPMVPTLVCEGLELSVRVDEPAGRKERGAQIRKDRIGLELPGDGGSGTWIVRARAYDDEGRTAARKEIEIRTTSDVLEFKKVRDPNSWLESGSEGQLETYLPAFLGDEKQPSRGAGCVKLPSFAPFVTDTGRGPSSRLVSEDEADERLLRTIEILSAIFSNRYALSTVECVDLLKGMPWAEQESWEILEDFVQNGLLRRIHPRRWSGQMLSVGQPMMFLLGPDASGRRFLRVVGLLSKAMRGLLAARGASPPRLWVASDYSSCGAWELEIESEDEFEAIAKDSGWPCARWNTVGPARLPALERILSKSARENLEGFAVAEKAVWMPRLGRFIAGGTDESKSWRMERWRALGNQDLFVLHRGESPVWNTLSKTWALLVSGVVGGEAIGRLHADGGVSMGDWAVRLPPMLARRTLALGGGVIFRFGGGGRYYPAGSCWRPAEACESWRADGDRVGVEPGTLALPAKARYEVALQRRRRLNEKDRREFREFRVFGRRLL